MRTPSAQQASLLRPLRPERSALAELSYGLTEPSHNLIIGAGGGARSRNLCLGKAALFQLSYTRILVETTGFEPVSACSQNKCLPIRPHPHYTITAFSLVFTGRRTESRTRMSRLSVGPTTVVVFSYGGG